MDLEQKSIERIKMAWDFYWHECKRHNPLYQMGYTRVGCIGCPLAGEKERKSLRISRHTSGHISEHLKR